MARLGGGTGLRQIPLSQIVGTGNVRADYRDIEELAESIKKNGQLEPVLVKALDVDSDGIDKFELVAGYRRCRALQHLCDKGEGFTNISAIVVTGDKLTLQLVENLQRSDLTAVEREAGIYQMCETGVSQKEVAARLSKSAEYVSRNIAAHKIREAAKAAGIDTAELATGTLNEIQAAAPADYPALVDQIKAVGGTLEAARGVMGNYNISIGKPAHPRKEKVASPPVSAPPAGISDPLGIDPLASFEAEPLEKPTAKPAPKQEEVKPDAAAWIEEFNPPHKQVDFNDFCLVIMEYGKGLEREIAACKKFVGVCSCTDRCETFYKHEAVMDIIALLHAGL